MRRAVVVALIAVAATALPAAGETAPPRDYAAVALNILPPGQSGDLRFPPTASDQLKLYDALTPRVARVARSDLGRYFKPEGFGVSGKVVRVERPRAGLRILRDRWGVPHVYGRTRGDVEFGAGWATAEDRFVFLELLRGPGRIAAMDVPGVDPFALATSGRQFVPTAATEQRLQEQIRLIRGAGAKGRQLYADVKAYVAGINAYYKRRSLGPRPWTVTDVIAVGSLLGANLGVGGGDETRRSMFLDALINRFGDDQGVTIWRDLAERNDPSAPVSVEGTFRYDTLQAPMNANVVVEDGSFQLSGGLSPLSFHFHNPVGASNALLVSARRSATHHPLFVAGPQVGYFYPEILLELDLHGGGIDARGAAFPGLSFYVLLGRGKDFAWSATSANSDIVDQYAETLCGDDTHYLFRGECRAMTTFDAGLLEGTATEPDRELVFRETVHGPVLGYATIGGRHVAISSKRSTRGRELLSALAFQDLNTNRVHDVRRFYRTMNQLEFTFNWFYADDRDIAMFSSGRLPIRADDVASGLPTIGDGNHEWRGFEPLARHARGANPKSGVILNWNNKPAGGFSASDDNWSYGPVQRVQLLAAQVAKRQKHTLASLVGAMNAAGTQDLRAVRVLPTLVKVLGTPPEALNHNLPELLDKWRERGASRLDGDLDGKIDDPGAAIMDAAWPRIADAVMRPTLGPLTDRLKRLIPVDDPANPGGSSYYNGWYSYVVKDLAAERPTLCGGGDPQACRASLWAAMAATGSQLRAEQGPDANAWRADATGERLSFGFLPKTARWTNRPTFQQVITFDGHRRR
jgi:acyl-homoserine lactone acylase PvdQ